MPAPQQELEREGRELQAIPDDVAVIRAGGPLTSRRPPESARRRPTQRMELSEEDVWGLDRFWMRGGDRAREGSFSYVAQGAGVARVWV